MAQYLWSAGVLMAEIVGGGLSGLGGGGGGAGSTLNDEDEGGIPLTRRTTGKKRDEDDWNVCGEKVLELGAGEKFPLRSFWEGGNGRAEGVALVCDS